MRVAMVSRGYGSQDGRPNDEALELAEKLPDVPHVLDPDRVAGAGRAIDEFGCQMILLDDGFQHRRLARDFDLVLIDALEPFGFEHVFPRGTLREPLAGWSRADAFMLTRADQVDDSRSRRSAAAGTRVCAAGHLAGSDLRAACLALCRRQRAAARRTGRPADRGVLRHRQSRQLSPRAGGLRLQRDGVSRVCRSFAYAAKDIEELAAWADALDVAAVICTHKDLVKVGPHWQAAHRCWLSASRLQITVGQRRSKRHCNRSSSAARQIR